MREFTNEELERMRVHSAGAIFSRGLTPEEIAEIKRMPVSTGKLEPLDVGRFPVLGRSITVFTPDDIQAALDKNLAAGLRQIADAIDSGTMEGKLLDCHGHGLGAKNDDRAHVLLRVDLAAPIRQENPFTFVETLNEKPAPDEAYVNATFKRKEKNDVSGSDQGK